MSAKGREALLGVFWVEHRASGTRRPQAREGGAEVIGAAKHREQHPTTGPQRGMRSLARGAHARRPEERPSEEDEIEDAIVLESSTR